MCVTKLLKMNFFHYIFIEVMQNDKSKEQEDKLKSLSEKVVNPKIKASIDEKIKALNTEIKK